MATSSVSGKSSSGLDVASIVSGLMDIERRPANVLAGKIAKSDVVISSVGVVKAKVSALHSALADLKNPLLVSSKSVTSNRSDAVTAEASSGASASDIEIKVLSTAQAGRLAMSGFSSETAAVGGGSLTIETGAYSAAGGVTSFAASGTKTIQVPADATLTSLRDLINSSGASVQANIVKSGATYSLVMTGANTGESNALRVAVSDSTNLPAGAPGLDKLAYSQVTGQDTQATLVQAARNAVVYVDGLRVERDSNRISGVVPGVTFQLRKPTYVADVNSAETSVLSVSASQGQLRGMFDRVVGAYNDLAQTYKALTQSDVDAAKRGALNGDSILEALMTRTRSAILNEGMSYTTTDSAGATVTNALPFWKFGVELQRDGTFKIDDTKFSAALTDGTADKLKLGVTISSQTFLKSALDSGGMLDSRETSAKRGQKLLQDQKVKLEDQLSGKEARYRQQYAALDATLFKLNNMNTALTQVLDQLTNSQKK